MRRNNWYRNRSLFVRPAPPKPPRKPVIRYVLANAFKRMLMAFGALFFLSLLMFSFTLATVMKGAKPPVYPNEFVLHFPIEGDFDEYHAVEGPFGVKSPAFRDIVDLIDSARRDPRVKGLLVDIQGRTGNIAQIQELRAAITRFRESGRFAYIYASSYGGAGQGMGSYYLASVFDEIWMQPVGAVSVAGLRAEVPYLRGALEKIGIEPQFFARKEYKSVFESVTNREMSPANREMLTALIGDLAAQLVGGIAQARGMEPAAFDALVNTGLLTDREAAEAGLVTTLGGFPELKAKISVDLTGRPNQKIFVDMLQYKPPRARTGNGSGATALIYVTGSILSASEMVHAPAFYGRDNMSAEQIEEAIMDAVADGRIRTLVIRIDSPGGSPVAAETIRRALLRARAADKKIIVSMGSTAASGGYWVAAPADVIFAEPGTLTGSIGVAGGKLVLGGLWNKVGVNWDSVQYGDNAGMWSFNEAFSAEAAARMNHLMDAVYDDFIARVAEGRNMTPEAVDEVARCRVWTGAQAKERGLVDELGGLSDALEYAAALKGYANRFAMPLQVLPEPKSAVELLVEMLSVQAGMAGHVSLAPEITAWFNALRPALEQGDYMTYRPLTVQ